MPSISKSEHHKFTAYIQSFLCGNNPLPSELQHLQNDLARTDLLFERYQLEINRCLALIEEYKLLQRSIKARVRKNSLVLNKSKIKQPPAPNLKKAG